MYLDNLIADKLEDYEDEIKCLFVKAIEEVVEEKICDAIANFDYKDYVEMSLDIDSEIESQIETIIDNFSN